MSLNYYEESKQGSVTLTPEFKKAIEEGSTFKRWAPNRRMPSVIDNHTLVVSDLCCKEIRLPLKQACILEGCSIDELFIANMNYLECSNSFANNVHCVQPQFIENLIAKTIVHNLPCKMNIKNMIRATGASTKRSSYNHFNVSSWGDCEASPALRKIISEPIPVDRYLGDINLPELPEFAQSLDYLFAECNVESMDLSGWNTRNITRLACLFLRCPNLFNLNLSGWDTSNVLSMECIFLSCSNLKTLDLSGWDISNVICKTNMFYGCSGLIVTVDASQLDNFNALGYKPNIVTFVTK